MKFIIFDLFGTLIDSEAKSEYNKALEWLANTYFDNRLLELKKLSESFKTKYLEDRKNYNRETSFFTQLAFFESNIGIKIYDNFNSVELKFIHIFRREKVINSVPDLLTYLNKRNYKIYVLSNSIFSGKNLKIYLDYLGIGNYIEEVFSSADIGARKPSEKAFSYIAEKLEITNTKAVYFVGNSFEKDYSGAKEFGFTPILIGTNDEINGLSFNSINQLLSYLKNSF